MPSCVLLSISVSESREKQVMVACTLAGFLHIVPVCVHGAYIFLLTNFSVVIGRTIEGIFG